MIKNSSVSLGVIFAILGVVLFSAKAIMVKLAYRYGIDTVTLLFFRMMFALPFYIAIAFWKKPLYPKEIKTKDYLWIAFFGFVGYYLASLFDFEGLQFIKAGLERIILFIYPTLVVLLSWLFFKKKITKIQATAICITYFGVLAVFWNEIGLTGDAVLWGGFLIFLSALTYALYLVGSGWLIPKFGSVSFTAYAMIASTIYVAINYFLSADCSILFTYPTEVYLLGLAMAIFSTLIPSFLVSEAIGRLGASTFSIFGSLGPISTIILAYFFLDETITSVQVIGMLIVILGVALVTRVKQSQK
ncbi:drug/metabolite transporter (DMT)-like permease [Saonia flava]|uniref:Drug/metabolite transporter (DMT)-like permease n=1 Tax=Saonia flava TaxID=523696 RepID=A0A846QRZ8_9FLAO|nr:DMT family transporter [Saonia flava]NJB69750.1 drug/metabolite transporter (DMT)-like permease [Saonia flava]